MPDVFNIERISIEGCIIYGPYLRPDGRKHVIIYNPLTRKKKTVSYPKYLLQYIHNIDYGENDTTDHIDENFKNDDLNNLQKLERGENVKKSLSIKGPFKSYFRGTCSVCSKVFEKELRNVKGNHKKGRTGPFCSRSCAGLQNQFGQVNFRKPRLSQPAEERSLKDLKSEFESQSGDQN